jgi:hypothetical protein
MGDELNAGLSFSALTNTQQESFYSSPVPVLVKFEAGDCVYKWSDSGTLMTPDTGRISEYWFPWDSGKIGPYEVEGFKEFRMRHRNRGGSVGRPQQAARSLGAVTEQWSGMSSILKAQFLKPVWGFVGKTAGQRKFNDPNHPAEQDNIYFIGGAYQIVIPNLSANYIKKM